MNDQSEPVRNRCGTCIAFEALSKECRKKSPHPIMLQTGQGVTVAGVFPVTKEGNWCLEYQAVPMVMSRGAH